MIEAIQIIGTGAALLVLYGIIVGFFFKTDEEPFIIGHNRFWWLMNKISLPIGSYIGIFYMFPHAPSLGLKIACLAISILTAFWLFIRFKGARKVDGPAGS